MLRTTLTGHHARRARPLGVAGVVLAAAFATPAPAQTPLDRPVGVVRPYALDAGVRSNPADGPAVVFRHDVVVEDAAWLRLHFGRVDLAPGSVVRLTALHDGAVQRLDAAALRQWRNTSAYFNGDTVRVELVAAGGSASNRLVLGHVTMQAGDAGVTDGGLCGICDGDDRTASEQDFAGRLLPSGCSATVWNESSCVVSAGHCAGGADIIQFRVPPSNPDCSLAHPPVEEQFPIVMNISSSSGVGDDWAALRAGNNNLGVTPFERYGVFRPIATATTVVGRAVDVWGYGVDDVCVDSQTQQRSTGFVNGVGATAFTHDADTTFGNSGSSIIIDDAIAGIATHCGCPTNIAMRIDDAAFTAARAETCPCTGDVDGDGIVGFSDLLKIFINWGQTGGPSDLNDDGIVNILDLLIVLSAWGAC
ncbi:MAG: hypothetical protein HKO59_01815 [Phycisphaerales bacterium]|nr:hypothetical protein [Phycisphaerales bacterium]